MENGRSRAGTLARTRCLIATERAQAGPGAGTHRSFACARVAPVTDSTDWRVTISLSGQANVEQARQSFSEQEVEQDVRSRLGHNVVVGAGDSQIFLYAGTEL